MVERVGPRVLLVFRTHKVSEAAFVVVGAVVQQKLDHGGVLVHDGDMQDVLTWFGEAGEERAVKDGRNGKETLGENRGRRERLK